MTGTAALDGPAGCEVIAKCEKGVRKMYRTYSHQLNVCVATSRKNEMSLSLEGRPEENCSVLDTL